MDAKKTKKITKKYINEVLRSEDLTKICHLFFKIHGYVNLTEVKYFIQENSPLKRIRSNAYWFIEKRKNYNKRILINDKIWRKHGEYQGDTYHYIIQYLKKQCADPTSPYAKRPMYGYTHLYFCSPIYGHSDYNKWRALKIEGNEKFCEKLIAYADKYFKD